MAKSASQRRLDKRSTALGSLAASNPEHAKRVLEKLLRGWVGEAWWRANGFRVEEEGQAPLKAFALVQLAERYVEALGPEAARWGGDVLVALRHECAKAVAVAADSRLYVPSTDCTTRLRALNVRNRQRD